MIIKNVDKKALAEVYAYLNFVGPRYLSKIPKEFIELIRSKMDRSYYYHLPIIEMIADEKLMRETRVMLAYIECKYIIPSTTVIGAISRV